MLSTLHPSPIQLLAALSLGLWLGVLYFGGLWLTLRQLPRFAHPFRLILASFLLRLSMALFGVYLLIRSLPVEAVVLPALICMLGFLAMRTLLIAVLRPRLNRSTTHPITHHESHS